MRQVEVRGLAALMDKFSRGAREGGAVPPPRWLVYALVKREKGVATAFVPHSYG